MFIYNLFNRFRKYGHVKNRWDYIVEEQLRQGCEGMQEWIDKQIKMIEREQKLAAELRKPEGGVFIDAAMAEKIEEYIDGHPCSCINCKCVSDPGITISGCDSPVSVIIPESIIEGKSFVDDIEKPKKKRERKPKVAKTILEFEGEQHEMKPIKRTRGKK